MAQPSVIRQMRVRWPASRGRGHPRVQAGRGELTASAARDLFEDSCAHKVQEFGAASSSESDDLGDRNARTGGLRGARSTEPSGPGLLNRGAGDEARAAAVSLRVEVEFPSLGHQADGAHGSVEFAARCGNPHGARMLGSAARVGDI